MLLQKLSELLASGYHVKFSSNSFIPDHYSVAMWRMDSLKNISGRIERKNMSNEEEVIKLLDSMTKKFR